jgi:hypothetical protein
MHVLVAKLFLPPPGPGQTQINHKDLNSSNNRFDNLEWCTRSENVRHSYATNPDRKSNRCRRVGATDWQVFDSLMDAARALGANNGRISTCCHANA